MAGRLPDRGEGLARLWRADFWKHLTLASLIAPASEDEFRARYWETKPLIVHRDDPDYYDDLFTLQDFDDALMRGPADVRVANDVANRQFTQHGGGTTPALEVIFAGMQNGFTLVLDHLHSRDPKLGLLVGPCRRSSDISWQPTCT